MKRGTVLGIIVGFVVLGATVAPVGGMGHDALFQTGDVDPDSVNIVVDLRDDGSAAWTIQYRVQLTDENETEAYDDLVADVENNSSVYVDRFATRINNTVAEAETETGRTMRATDFEVSASVEELTQRYGTLTYSFVWHGFATVEGDEIHAGDAIDGFFLDSSTTMSVSWPAGYSLESVEPSPASEFSSRFVWEGPLEFVDDEPRIVLEPAPPTTTTSTTTVPGMDGSDDALLLVALVIGAVIVLAFIAVWYHQRRMGGDGEADGTPDRPPSGGGPPEAPAPPPEEPDETPEELLSNEERVSRFLARHGGRSKQQEIVEGLEWTEAKTSQVLSSMADEGSIEKFRIGRENVVKLPEDDDSTEER